MNAMRDAVLRNDFLEFYQRQRRELVRTDEEHPNRPVKLRERTEPPTHLGDYEVHSSPNGFSSIRQISSGEVMHSVNDPREEANKLYIEQSCLASRLADPSASAEEADELVIWDVGLGAGSNAMAAIHCFESEWKKRTSEVGLLHPMRPMRSMRLVSFEHDLDSLRLAIGNPRDFPHIRHGAPHDILKSGGWKHGSGLLSWELIEGDFLEKFESAIVPDLIFYDPFSFKTNARFWTPAVFSQIFEKISPKSVELYTYSASTAVRVALLTAGFFVAEGVGMGPKSSTTLAFSRASGAVAHPLAPALLGPDWLARWKRSHLKVPAGLSGSEAAAFEKRIESHPQFSVHAVRSE
jgi:queuine tRNA-ribosyltransferase